MISIMSNFDWFDLDARLLRLLVAVIEAGSITAAAARLDVTQSAVSHLLGKLRAIVGDELFVKSGRGIRPTPRAELLAARARELLRALEDFAAPETFDPARWSGCVTIAANDFQRETLLPALAARLRTAAPDLALRLIPSNVPSAEMLRDEVCQLILSPRPPDGSDIVQKKLFEDRYRVFYDPTRRAAPESRAAYLAADHATVVYEPRRAIELDDYFARRGLNRRIMLMAPGFAALPSFIRGTDLIATAPGLLRLGPMRDLASAAVPLACPGLPIYMIWSRRRQDDPAHVWLRAEVEACARRLPRRSD